MLLSMVDSRARPRTAMPVPVTGRTRYLPVRVTIWPAQTEAPSMPNM